MKKTVFSFSGMLFLYIILIFTNAEIEGKKRDVNKTDQTRSKIIEIQKPDRFPEHLNTDYLKMTGKRCLVKRLPESLRQKKYHSSGHCSIHKTEIRPEYWPEAFSYVPVVFHIIHKTDGEGNIENQKIFDQISVLNEDFGALSGTMGEQGFDTKIRFRLIAITRTANDDWFYDMDEKTYKTTLGWDQNKFLNIYVNSAAGYLGYAYFPQEASGNIHDGIVLNYEVVGGRNNNDSFYNQGRTLVHETGHYFGLFHTFEDPCGDGYESGDLIVDTNTESTEHYTCFQTHTCGTPDPIHNYMNYTDDDCMHRFTPEQANRMVCAMLNFRPLLHTRYLAPVNVTLTRTTNNLIFREEQVNIINWEQNPLNHEEIVKYVISRKKPDESGYVQIGAVTGTAFSDRDLGEQKYSYLIYGVSESGTNSIPVIVENDQ